MSDIIANLPYFAWAALLSGLFLAFLYISVEDATGRLRVVVAIVGGFLGAFLSAWAANALSPSSAPYIVVAGLAAAGVTLGVQLPLQRTAEIRTEEKVSAELDARRTREF